MLGSYRMARLIERGGMGIVYKAVHPEIGSPVAIKVLSDVCAGRPDLVARFFDEARAVNMVHHDNIVNVHHMDQLPDGRPYIVMEFLEGEPLSAVLERHGRLPLGSIANLMKEVLGGLGAAHEKNIVHRDLKPQNIFVTPQGHAKVLDFGVAKLKGFSNVRTATGAVLGTPYYMSPEQAQADDIDGRSDLYAVGIILFECITGDKPFTAKSPYGVRTMHIETPPPKPSERRADIPADYEALILRTLAKDPADRHQTASELAAALTAVTQDLPPVEWTPLVPSQEVAPPVYNPPTAATVSGRPRAKAEARAEALAPATIRDIPRQDARPAATGRHTVPRSIPHVYKRKTWAWLVVAIIALGLGLYAALAGSSKKQPTDESIRESNAKRWEEHAAQHNVLRDYDVDYANFDPSAFLPTARSIARQMVPDAELVYFDAYGVRPDGRADVRTSANAATYYRFRSLANETVTTECVFLVVRGDYSTSVSGQVCPEAPQAAPRLTTQDVWKIANRDGVASVGVAMIRSPRKMGDAAGLWFIQSMSQQGHRWVRDADGSIAPAPPF
jgi:serine/threonine protein kinase